METLGVGIVGYGFMGRTHTYAHRTIPFHYAPPPIHCELRWVCRTTPEGVDAAMREGGFPHGTTDPLELVRAADVDLVHICTPNNAHYETLAEAVRLNKHIYVDKPVTGSLEEADAIAARLPQYEGRAQVALQYRFFPATLRAKQLMDEGFLGAVTHFRAAYLHSGSVDPNKAVNWKSTAAAGGGVIRDLGSHVLDLLMWLLGPFSAVSCASRIWAAERPSLDRPGTRMKIDVEDVAHMLLRTPGGAIGAVEASKIATGTEDELRFEIHGRHGALRFNLMDPNYLDVYDMRQADGEYGGERGWRRIACMQKYPPPGNKFPGPKFSIGWLRGHIHSLYSFLCAVADGKSPRPSLEQGIHLQRVLETVRRSAASGQWLDLPEYTADVPY